MMEGCDFKKTFSGSIQITPKIAFDTGVITLDILEHMGNDIAKHRAMILDTQDNAIRESLIALGWTPPSVAKLASE